MATMTIRNLDDGSKMKLRVRAARRGVSMEEEAREILRSALSADVANHRNLALAIRDRIEPLGGVDLPRPDRDAVRSPPRMDE